MAQQTQYLTAKAVLALEIDLTAQSDAFRLPPPLDKAEAAAMGELVAKDLARLLPGVERQGLCVAGAVYDQTQILSPGYPLYAELKKLFIDSFRGHDFQPAMLTFGAADGEMPTEVLQPVHRGPAGPLLLLPMVLVGPDRDEILALADKMETVFMEQGHAAAETAYQMQQQLGLPVAHARYMTCNDLAAMLQIQLGHVGLDALWQILENVLYQADDQWVQTASGNAFFCHDGQVDALFQTFNRWSQHPPGSAVETDNQRLAQAYSDYIRSFRQFVTTLTAHRVPVAVYVDNGDPNIRRRWPEDKPQPVNGDFFVEASVDGSSEGVVRITVQSGSDVGTVAFTRDVVAADGTLSRRDHFYPVEPSGLETIQAQLQQSEATHTEFAYPGKICYNPQARELTSCDSLKNSPYWH